MEPIDPRSFDRMVRQARPEALWGLPAIAAALRISVRTAARWALDGEAGLPIQRVGGRWFARRSELEAWRSSR